MVSAEICQFDHLMEYDYLSITHCRTMRRAFGASDPKSRIDTGQLEQLSVHVQAAVVGADHFQATLGVIATWENATFQGLFVPTGRADHYPVSTLTVQFEMGF